MKELRKSIPVDFSRMTVAEIEHAVEVIKGIMENAKVKEDRGILSEESENITVPLRCLAEAMRVNYVASIEIKKITAALDEIEKKVSALVEFEKSFFEMAEAEVGTLFLLRKNKG